MIKIIKKLFTKTKKREYTPDPPGRTFKRILTGRYFGCEDVTADAEKIAQAKKEKIDVNLKAVQGLFILPAKDLIKKANIVDENQETS